MFIAFDTLKGMALDARDGRIGKVRDLYFDGQSWTVRYLLVDTGNWLPGREVLLSPFSLGRPDPAQAAVPVDLTLEQIRGAPSPDTDRPVSRQFERSYFDFFGYPYYWRGGYLWGAAPFPVYPPADHPERGATSTSRPEEAASREEGDPDLHSAREVRGYHVAARDGEIGHIEDFLLDAEDWNIRYVGVDTRNWLPGKTVAIPPRWIHEVRWPEKKVLTDRLRDEIRQAPSFDRESYLTREFAEEVERFFGAAEARA